MSKKFTLLPAFILNCLFLFPSSPGLIWHQTYGEPTYNQQVLVMALDNYDNMFAAGYVYFGNNGNILVNRYDGAGNLMWNRLYNNTYSSANPDQPVALFPDNQAGVTVVGYVNTQAAVTHILYYDAHGNLQVDSYVGDTTAGSKTIPVAVIYDGASSFYMIGQLNNASRVFKCNYSGQVLWSVPLNNNYNNEVGNISFDPNGNIIAGVFDSVLPQVRIHRYNANTGDEMPGFNTGIDSLPVNGNFIRIQVDGYSNIFVAATGKDFMGRTQLVVDKFDTTGTHLWSTMCNSTKGYSNTVNSFLLDHTGDVIISGPYTDDADTLQYGAVYKIPGDSGGVIWSVIDSQFLVNEAVARVDQYSNVYLGTTKTPSAISLYYSQFSFSELSSDSGVVQWNRSFDNTADNTGLLVQVNNFGDVFFADNSPTDSDSVWFLGRVGNAANDSAGTAVQSITDNDISLTVFPNPCSSVTNLGFTALQSENFSLKLYNVSGQLLQEQQLESTPGYNQLGLKVPLVPGVYLIKLGGESSMVVQRVIVY